MKDKILDAIEDAVEENNYIIHVSFIKNGKVKHSNFAHRFPYLDLQAINENFLKFLKEIKKNELNY